MNKSNKIPLNWLQSSAYGYDLGHVDNRAHGANFWPCINLKLLSHKKDYVEAY